jgi:hypothetical protein
MQLALPQQAGRSPRSTELRPWGVARLIGRTGKGRGIGLVEDGLRDRRHGKVRGPWYPQRLARIAGDTDLHLGLAIEGLELAIGDGPVHAPAIARAQAEIMGQEAQGRAQPMPGRAACDLEIGAFEFVGALLPVPEIRIVGDGMHGLGRCGIGAFRHLDYRVAKALGRIAPIDLGPGSRIAT